MTYRELAALTKSKQYMEFAESGDRDRCETLLTHSYILATMATYYQEEAVSLIERHHLNHFALKQATTRFTRAFDLYMSQMQSFLPGMEEKKAFCEACDNVREKLDKIVDESLKRQETWHQEK